MSQVKTDKGNVEIKNSISYKGGTPKMRVVYFLYSSMTICGKNCCRFYSNICAY